MCSQSNTSITEDVLSRLKALLEDARLEPLMKALGNDAKLHIVGGTVRDALLNRALPPHKNSSDLDAACSLPPEEIQTRLEKVEMPCYPTGLKHQTLTIKPLPSQPPIELTTFRDAQMSPSGGRSISNDIETDLCFRDFTINAMALSLDTSQLIDPLDARKDLDKGVIRAVGSAEERFSEDPLRVFRMVRLSSELDFSIHPETLNSVSSVISLINDISIERIREEFSKTLLSPSPKMGLQLLHKLGLLEIILPEIARFEGFEQNEFHQHDLLSHTLEVVQSTSPNLILRLAALFHDVSKPETLSVDSDTGSRHFYRHEAVGADVTTSVLKRLRYPNHITNSVSTLVRTHMRPLSAGPGGLRRLLRDTAELLPLWRELVYADASATNMDKDTLQAGFERFDSEMDKVIAGPEVSPLKNLAVSGEDLLRLGYEEGPVIGDILRALHESVLDDPELNHKDLLIDLAKKMKLELA